MQKQGGKNVLAKQNWQQNLTGDPYRSSKRIYQSLHFSGRTIGDPSGQLKDRWKSSELDTGPITLYSKIVYM